MRIVAVMFALFGAAPVTAQEPGSHLKVYLMTMGPGAEIYERFGHNAIWIRDTVARTDRIYNFGMFDVPSDPAGILAFGAKFAMGPPRYWLGVDRSLDVTLVNYQHFKRDVAAQELNFAPAQRADLAARLEINARDENKFYAYDYFRDNCSTRVRDILDLELGGALKRATVGTPAAGTFRFHTQRSITNDKLLFVGIDMAFGPRVDQPLDQWDEMFLPEKVADRIGELTIPGSDGQSEPLATNKFSLLTIGAFHVEQKPPPWGIPFLVIGLGIAGLMRLTDARRINSVVSMFGRVIGGAWMLLMGAGGMILLFFWIATQHIATWANHNLLIASPLALGLVSSFWYRSTGAPRPWAPRLAMVLMGSVLVGVFLTLVSGIGGQQNQLITALTALPTFVGALEALRRSNRRKRSAPKPLP